MLGSQEAWPGRQTTTTFSEGSGENHLEPDDVRQAVLPLLYRKLLVLQVRFGS